MTEQVKTKKLLRVMNNLGFKAERRGSHAVMRHAPTNTIMTVPMDVVNVPPIFLKTLSQQIENTGVISAAAFDSQLRK
ncbi:type II toxin-antitoxin system HicA family toxin [uncultured Methylobacterium sp.]|jgi:predicted RNA binding protein YcfA (HicA-like mRNA interferase family)|uniref:type II toxin-antitoxin system HicA family toxin n=1 Tax=uncultured Methylobacterium sp. TaxID=157278 RepID=UPI00260A3759|nr:type II toxin-antitoxin system HicA family toxin [uncultured Methylobacterium sp.]